MVWLFLEWSGPVRAHTAGRERGTKTPWQKEELICSFLSLCTWAWLGPEIRPGPLIMGASPWQPARPAGLFPWALLAATGLQLSLGSAPAGGQRPHAVAGLSWQ